MKPLPHKAEIWGGIECTINRVGSDYLDQLEYSGHRERNGDIDLFADLGITKMRYPILWEHHQPSKNAAVNWDSVENKLLYLRRKGIDVIAGLVHHGSGPNYVEIAEDSFADGLVAYAGAVAEKFPWIKYYTPVNEPLTTARFCGLYGLWYPHQKNDATFCRILINECKATAMAMKAIRKTNPFAELIQTDDLAMVHSSPGLKYQADFENERRWLSYDLLCGLVNNSHALWPYLIGAGISAEELNYFCEHPCPPTIIGVNYYLTSERFLDEDLTIYPEHTYGSNGRETYADVEAVRVAKANPAGIKYLLKEAWDRYNIPLAVAEVHLHCTREEQMRWLDEVWQSANSLILAGVPVIAITPWVLLGSYGWDKLLTHIGGTYEPGVFDISNGNIRETMLAKMIRAYSKSLQFKHPVLASQGWWHRATGICYGIKALAPYRKSSKKKLILSGWHMSALAIICRDRCLPFIESGNSDTELPDEEIWARIDASEQLKFKEKNENALIVSFEGLDTLYWLNAGLDLFLDNETGFWSIEGSLKKQTRDIAITEYLAS